MSILKFIAMIFIASMTLLIFGHVILDHSSLKSASQAFNQHSWTITLFRYFTYVLIIGMWPYLINFLGKHKKWSAETIRYLSKQRVKLGLFFAIIELFFVYNFIGNIFS